MIRFLSRLFIRDCDNVADPAVRRAYGVLCGAVGTARLVLDKHTPAQVYAGWALGAACCTVFLSFL